MREKYLQQNKKRKRNFTDDEGDILEKSEMEIQTCQLKEQSAS